MKNKFLLSKNDKRISVNRAKLQNEASGWLMLLPAIFIVYFVVIRPQFQGFAWSFFDMKGYRIGEFVGFDNYIQVMKDSMFAKTFWNTCEYVLWSLVLGFGLPVVLAICLNEMVHARNTFRFFIYLPSALPGVAAILIWYFMYYPDQGGLLNMILSNVGVEPYQWLQDSRFTIFYIVVTMTWSAAGTTTIYYFAALQGVNKELYEAAMIDGAGFFRRCRVVAFPHISGIALLFLVRQIIGVFSIMEQPMQMTDGGPNGASMTLGLQLYKYGFVTVKPQLAMALGVIMFAILMVFTCFYFYLNKKVEDNM